MPDTPELSNTADSKQPIPEKETVSDDGVSSGAHHQNQECKEIAKYDDTAEVQKILETVISAQPEKKQASHSPVTKKSETSPPSHQVKQTEKTVARSVNKTEVSTAKPDSNHTANPLRETPALASSSTRIPTDEIEAVQNECKMLKTSLAQKNRVLSTGFARLNYHLQSVRSQLDQLQTHLDKLSQESLKDIRSPLPDKVSWPQYAKTESKDTLWKPVVEEIEKLHKKPAPAIDLKVENWPEQHSQEGKEIGEWDKTLVHLRRILQKKRDGEQEGIEYPPDKQFSRPHHGAERDGTDQLSDTFGNVRKSLRRMQNLVHTSTIEREEALPELESAEPEVPGQAPPVPIEPDVEATFEQGDRLVHRQYVKDLKHPDKVIRIKAVGNLAQSRLKSTPEILIDTWCDETEPEVRSTIIKALVALDYKEAISFFVDALDSGDINTQMAALEGLYKFETSKTTAGLLKALRSPFYHIRRRAVTYLGWSKVTVAFPQLLKALKDENEFVRKAVISTLFSLKNKEAIPALIEVLHDSSPAVRKKAAEVLYRWTGLRNDFMPNASGAKRLEGIDRWKMWWKKNGEKFQISRIYRADEPSSDSSSPAVMKKKEAVSHTSAAIDKKKVEKKQTVKKEKPFPPPVVSKRKPPSLAPTAVDKKKTEKKQAVRKKVGRLYDTAKSRRDKRTIAMEQEQLVLAADILPELITEPVYPPKPKKKSPASSVNEAAIEKIISRVKEGITMKELGDKLGVKWQTLIPKLNNLVRAKKVKKTGNKYKYVPQKKDTKS